MRPWLSREQKAQNPGQWSSWTTSVSTGRTLTDWIQVWLTRVDSSDAPLKGTKMCNDVKPRPMYSSVGGYPLFYLSEGHVVLCASCCDEAEADGDVASVTAHPNWEDPYLYCDACSCRIEEAYPAE